MKSIIMDILNDKRIIFTAMAIVIVVLFALLLVVMSQKSSAPESYVVSVGSGVAKPVSTSTIDTMTGQAPSKNFQPVVTKSGSVVGVVTSTPKKTSLSGVTIAIGAAPQDIQSEVNKIENNK